MSDFLLVLGVAVISAALRSFQNPILFRIGTLGIVATSFLAGWLLGGSAWLGAVLAASWLVLPWLEILTRARRLRLPIERPLQQRTPPSRNVFPDFSEVSNEIEEQGFEHVEDIGWNYEDNQQFYRVLSDDSRRTQACICLAEQKDFTFYYLSLTSRTQDGRTFMTWNYPFAYGLKNPPSLHLRKFPAQGPFAEMLSQHEKFLKAAGIESPSLLSSGPEEIVRTMQNEMRAQISHNIDIGLLALDGEKLIRYTPRGMFFLWFQFLRDLVRFS